MWMWHFVLTTGHKEPLLPIVANDFVIVDNQLHDQFDVFRKAVVKSTHSLIPMNELLYFYCASQCPQLLECSKVVKYGKTYLELHCSQMDKLVTWVNEMREIFYGIDGENIFESAAWMMLTKNSKVCYYKKMQKLVDMKCKRLLLRKLSFMQH